MSGGVRSGAPGLGIEKRKAPGGCCIGRAGAVARDRAADDKFVAVHDFVQLLEHGACVERLHSEDCRARRVHLARGCLEKLLPRFWHLREAAQTERSEGISFGLA